MQPAYKLVELACGVHSIHSVAHAETFHPVIGPAAEAEALYVRQLHLPDRLRGHEGEFVIWDVGLGAAANVITVLRATRGIACNIRLHSFDHTLEPLRFAAGHAAELGYFNGYETPVHTLLDHGHAAFEEPGRSINWTLHLADFPALIHSAAAGKLPKPHAIFFDAYSPAKNPAMWTLPLFARIHQLLDPARACALPTYSRSTLLRVSLLLAGFYVGTGQATGEKEQTTIAANTPALIQSPLDSNWLSRAHRSTSAEPLHDDRYRQAPLTDASRAQLSLHPQFRIPPAPQ